MPDFFFRGKVPPSKSLMNRALIIRSYSDDYRVFGESEAEDVQFLRKALTKIEDGREFYLGEGGTSLRFFALRVARQKGVFTLRGSERLFQRPQTSLVSILSQLGVEADLRENSLVVRSEGWDLPASPLEIPVNQSSQFASAVLLNSWNLSSDLALRFAGGLVSGPYLRMTMEVCRQAGMNIEESQDGLVIRRGQNPRSMCFRGEPDFSSLFSIAAMAALGGRACFEDVPETSLQPDQRGFALLEAMGAKVIRDGSEVIVDRASQLRAVDADLGDCPDLTPVLAMVAAFAEGTSILRGASHLRFKESDRISSTAALLQQAGVRVNSRDDGLEIEGNPRLEPRAFAFDPDEDHRLAMAVGLLMRLGWPVRLSRMDVVNKSFPEFWRVLGVGPHLVIGHRGTGKSSLLTRIDVSPKRDLDRELERENQQEIFEIMRNRGEEVFRRMEVALARHSLDEAGPLEWLASGAGLRLDEVQPQGDVLWIRRETDGDGRVFLDRPRLDPQTDPLAEFRERARLRESVYARWASREYTAPEGLRGPDESERRILFGPLEGVGGAVTLFPRHRRSIPSLGAELYELRDDLLDSDEIRGHFGKIPTKRILYSVRKNKTLPLEVRASDCWIDWGLEAGYPPKDEILSLRERLILSSHGTLKECLLDFRLFSHLPVHLKMSPWVESFEDLKAGHLWWSQDPERRSFLPRSAEGRWAWYRLWMKGRAFLNFWREGRGSSPDQPTLWQWLTTPSSAAEFAAVLGSPVHHSWTPVEHQSFFRPRGLPVWAIDIREGEWSKAFPFLEEIGLRFAAVTAPLKGRAFRSCEPTESAASLGSVNTLARDRSGVWRGDNTDLEGLRVAAENLPRGLTAIWGGGGTLPVLAKIFPLASAYSSRAGHVRQGSSPLEGSPSVVVWAAPRSADLVWPPSTWRPQVVFDLNYKEDSPGREYALKVGAEYRSGTEMFLAQAAQQRVFWTSIMKEDA